MQCPQYLQYGRLVSIKNKTVIYLQDNAVIENDFSIFFIIKGKVIIAKKTANNNYYRIGLGEKMLFGLAESNENPTKLTSAIAVDDCELYCWKFNDFLMNIQISITLARIATYSLCRELRFLNEKQELHFTSEQNITNIEDMEVNENVEIQNILCNLAFNADMKSIDKNIFDKFGKHFKKGDIMIRENDKSKDFFIVYKGEAEVLKNGNVIGKITAGEIVGEISYFDNTARTATVRASSDASVLVLTPENFNILYQLHPEWSMKIIKSMRRRIADAYKKI